MVTNGPTFWGDLAARFSAIESHQTLVVAHREVDGWVLDGRLGPLNTYDANSQFKSLARVAAAGLGESAVPDAYRTWLDRIVRDLQLDMRGVVLTGINHLAATLCRQYQVENELAAVAMPRKTSNLAPRTYAKALSIQREAKGWTAHELATQSDTDHRTVKKALTGQPVRDDVIAKIARALGCNLADLSAD